MISYQIKPATSDERDYSMTGSRFIFEQISKKGIEHIFMLPGKMVEPCMRDLTNMTSLTAIVATHEASAGYMADAYARVTENIGVALVISSPGAMNIVPAIAAAHAERIPVLVISGDIASYNEAKGAFQDGALSGTNDVSIFNAITSLSARVSHANSLPNYLNRAFERMSLPNKSPTFLQVPLDIQTKDLTAAEDLYEHSDYGIYADNKYVENTLERLLKPNSKNIFLLGSEARNNKFTKAIIELSERLNIPVASVLDSKGTFPEDHPLYLGVFGFAGNKRAMDVLLNDEVDNVIAFGVNFDQRATLSWSKNISTSAHWVNVSAMVGTFYKHSVEQNTVMCSPEIFAEQLLEMDKSRIRSADVGNSEWLARITAVPFHFEEEIESLNAKIHPAKAIIELRHCMPQDTIISVDSGSHRVFCAHYWKSYQPNSYLTSSSTAPMGWAISAGVAAKLARPKSVSVVVTGDGCMLMHGNEIQTAARYSIPVIFVVLNNSAHGAIHAESKKENSFDSEMTKLPQLDWCKYAESLGLQSYRIEDDKNLNAVYEEALLSNRACLIDVICCADAKNPNSYLK